MCVCVCCVCVKLDEKWIRFEGKPFIYINKIDAREEHSLNKYGICGQKGHNKKTNETKQCMLIVYICSKLCKLHLLFLIQLYRCFIVLQRLIICLYKTLIEAWFGPEEFLLLLRVLIDMTI